MGVIRSTRCMLIVLLLFNEIGCTSVDDVDTSHLFSDEAWSREQKDYQKGRVGRKAFLTKQLVTAFYSRGYSEIRCDRLPQHEMAGLVELMELQNASSNTPKTTLEDATIILHKRHDGYFQMTIKSARINQVFSTQAVTWVK